MSKKGIEHLKKYGIRETINKIIFKYFKTYLGFIYSKFSKVKPLHNQNRFKKIKIDTTYFLSDLCEISKKYKTDKPPFNLKHRHAYTGIYHFLFHKMLRLRTCCEPTKSRRRGIEKH